MAYTKTPMESTEQNKRIPLMSAWETRDASNSKDVDNLNVVWDVVQDPEGTYFEAVKREGLSYYATTFGLPYGAYFWEAISSYVLVTSFGLEVFGPSQTVTQVFTAELPVGPVTERVGFTEFLYDDGTVGLVFIVNNQAWIYNGNNGLTKITDPDFPTTVLPFPVFLDGYLFVADGKGNICNSDLNNPLSWASSNFISVESYGDPVLALARQGQYIVAFGLQSIQFFYDAGNPTGTPLAVQSKVLRIGYSGGLAATADMLVFLGRPVNGQPSVYTLQGTEAKEMQSHSATRRLSQFTSTLTSVLHRFGSILAINGHLLYTWINIDATQAQANDTTYALDLTTNMWTRLAQGNLNTLPIRTAVTRVNEFRFSTLISLYGSFSTFEFLPSNGVDIGTPFDVKFRTNNLDFGTRRMKFGSRLMLVCDQAPATSLCYIAWSDDDYKSYSTPRPVDLSAQYPVLWALGSFRTRSFNVSYVSPYPMRWRALELDYNQGAA